MSEARPRRHLEVEFARDLTLFDAIMIGVGAMIGAGIFMLTGMACGQAGPAAVLAFALNGFVTLLTAFSYAELASVMPEAGGGYAFVRRALSPPLGFLSGWMLWFAYTVACVLYARGFGSYLVELIQTSAPGVYGALVDPIGRYAAERVLALLVASGFIALNVAGAAVTGRTEDAITLIKIVLLLIFAAFGLRAIGGGGGQAAANFTPFMPNGPFGIILAMGLTFIAFEGYDLIATVSEEVQEPQRNIPRAIFWSLGVTVAIYLLVVFVCLGAVRAVDQPVWSFLGEYEERAIVKAAENFMPRYGGLLIVAGGLFSTMSALNATVLASSRVAFSMGRDRMLPEVLGAIHWLRRTPYIAILITGVIILAMAAVVPLATLGSGSSLLFLLSFALTNAAAIVIRYREPDLRRAYRIPFFPVTPVLGIATCLGLGVFQFWFDRPAWYIALAWIGLGLATFFLAMRKVVAPEREVYVIGHHLPSPGQYTVLVPTYNPMTAPNLAHLGATLAKARNGEVVLLSVVEVPVQLPPSQGMGLAQERRRLLERTARVVQQMGVPVETVIKIAHNTADGIIRAAREEQADMLVLGWRGWTGNPEQLLGTVLDKVVREAPCDLVVFKAEKDLEEGIGSIVTGVSASPHSDLVIEVAQALSEQWNCPADYHHVIKAGTDMDEQTRLRYLTCDLETRTGPPIELDVEVATSIPAAMVRLSRNYDMVVIGAARAGWLKEYLFGSKALSVAKLTQASVIMVKRAERTARSLFRRAFLGRSGARA
ncbi:MAG: amino acid permease [Armatimonadota bacterium]